MLIYMRQFGGKTIDSDICPTIEAHAGTGGGNVPIICIEGNGQRPSHKGDGYKESDIMYTLNSTEVHGVAYETDVQRRQTE